MCGRGAGGGGEKGEEEEVYLVQEDEGPLEGIVDLLVDWVSDHLPLHLLPSQPEVVVPQLVAGRGRQTINSKPRSSCKQNLLSRDGHFYIYLLGIQGHKWSACGGDHSSDIKINRIYVRCTSQGVP